MQYITIPTIDGKELKLSKYILGSDFPLSTPADVTSAIVNRYRALGGNTIDTAGSWISSLLDSASGEWGIICTNTDAR